MSGNVNVGFLNGRISSRVLKPPGGGHTEIFFEDTVVDSPKKQTPTKARTQTSIEAIICTEQRSIEKKVENLKIEDVATSTVETSSEKTEVTQNAVQEIVTTNGESEKLKIEESNGKVEESNCKVEEKQVIIEEVQKVDEEKPVARKQRVPPGGYTTALW